MQDEGEDLVAELRPGPAEGDEALIRLLYQEHGKALLAYATRLTKDQWVAEDIVQETLLRAWRNAAALDEQVGSIRGWLFTVTRNLVTDRARKQASSRAIEPADREPRVTCSLGRESSIPEVSTRKYRIVTLLAAAPAATVGLMGASPAQAGQTRAARHRGPSKRNG